MTIGTHMGRDELAANIRHWYWAYVCAAGGVSPYGEDPESRHHPEYDGGTDKWGHIRQPIWPELAQWAIEANIDIQSLLRKLAELHKNQKCLTPFEIHRYPLANLEQELTEHRRQVTQDLFYQLPSEIRAAKMAWRRLFEWVIEARKEVVHRIGEGPPIDEKNDGNLLARADTDLGAITPQVILDSTLDLSAVTRFCLAHRYGLSDLANLYFERAVVQYLEQPYAYDAVYGDFLPQVFRAAARKRLD